MDDPILQNWAIFSCSPSWNLADENNDGRRLEAVERMENATFIITPFDQDELGEKATRLLNSYS